MRYILSDDEAVIGVFCVIQQKICRKIYFPYSTLRFFTEERMNEKHEQEIGLNNKK